jgi:chromosome segregation ATPase
MTDANPQKSAYDDLERKVTQQSRAALWRTLAVTGIAVCAVAGYVWYSYAGITSLQSKLVAAQATGKKAVQLAQQVDALQAKMADAGKEVSTLKVRAAAGEEAQRQVARLETKLDNTRQEVSASAAAADKAHQQIAFLETKLDDANKETFLLKTQVARADKMKEEIATLRTNLASANEDVAALRTNLASANKEVAALKVRAASADKQADTLQARLVAANKDAYQWKTQTSTWKSQAANAAQRIATLEGQLAAAGKEASTWKSQAASAEQQIAALGDKLAAANAKVAPSPQCEKSDKLQRRIDALESKLADATNDVVLWRNRERSVAKALRSCQRRR